MPEREPRIGILIVAYNAAGTLANVLDRIPESFRARVAEVLVCDDFSQDSTYLVGLGYQQISDLPITVVRHSRNLGYGGNQKAGYRMAIQHGLDIIVLLHGDGQYAPECIESIVDPLIRGDCDAVFGSRMMDRGGALKGGMPLYKFVGNRTLTRFQNALLGTDLTEFHSGYRAYSVPALASIAFDQNSDWFDFDTEIIIQLLDAGKRIVEVPIPTYYGDEICYVQGVRYAKEVAADVLRHRFRKLGLGGGPTQEHSEYDLKDSGDTSHRHLVDAMASLPPSRVLDLGCSGGLLGEKFRSQGHVVTGVDCFHAPGVEGRLDHFVQADLEGGIPDSVGGNYDVVVAGDVVEHLSKPERILEDIHEVLRPGGTLLVSVPNFAHWYVRTRTGLGLFDYDRRGILDRTHLRFFTRRSFRRLAQATGWSVAQVDPVGLPLDMMGTGPSGIGGRMVRGVDRLGVALRPTLFAYQFLFRLHHESIRIPEPEEVGVEATPAGKLA